MAYFTIKQCSILYSFPMDMKEQRKLDVFLTVLESSGVGPIIASSVFGDGPNVGKKPYDPYRMFAFIVLAFSLKNTNALVKYELPEDTPGEEFPQVKPSKKKSEKMESKKAVRTDPLEESIS